MAAKTTSVQELADKFEATARIETPAEEFSIDRLAVDLFRHITFTFRVKPEVIPAATLPENEYPSRSFIKDVARPIVFYSIACRDSMQNTFLKFPAENMADKREDLELIHTTLFETEKESKRPDVYKQFILSVVLATELTQYLHIKDKRAFLKDMPAIWAKFFKARLHDVFKQSGGFNEYLAYWEFMKAFDSVTLRFIKHCTPYGASVSDKYKSMIVKEELFVDKEAQRKILGFDSGTVLPSFNGKTMLETVDMLGFVPHEFRYEPPSTPVKPVEEGSSANPTGATALSPAPQKVSKKKQKQKARPGQSYLKFKAERQAKVKEGKGEEEQKNLAAGRAEGLGQTEGKDDNAEMEDGS